MHLGAMNDPEKDVLKELHTFGELNFDFVDIAFEGPKALPDILLEKRKEIKDILSTYEMFAVAHVPWYFEIGHPYESIAKAYQKETFKVIEAAADLGIDKAGLHINVPKGRFSDKLGYNLKALKEIVQFADKFNISVSVENLDVATFSVEDFRKILKIQNLGFLLDIGHANLGLRSSEEIFIFLKEFSRKLAHVHAHDNDGRGDLHLPVGAGNINWKGVVRELKKVYNGTITLEIHSKDRDYLRLSREKILYMWKKGKMF